jgi:hypothetical protein
VHLERAGLATVQAHRHVHQPLLAIAIVNVANLSIAVFMARRQ